MKYFKNYQNILNELNRETYLSAADKAKTLHKHNLARDLKAHAKEDTKRKYFKDIKKTVKKMKENNEDNIVHMFDGEKFIDFDNIQIHRRDNYRHAKDHNYYVAFIIDIPYYTKDKWKQDNDIIRAFVAFDILDENIRNKGSEGDKKFNDFYWRQTEDFMPYKLAKLFGFKEGKNKFPFDVKYPNGHVQEFTNMQEVLDVNVDMLKHNILNQLVGNRSVAVNRKDFMKLQKGILNYVNNNLNTTNHANRMLKDFLNKNNLKHFFEFSSTVYMDEKIKKSLGNIETKFLDIVLEEKNQVLRVEIAKDVVADEKFYKGFIKYLKSEISVDEYMVKQGFNNAYDFDIKAISNHIDDKPKVLNAIREYEEEDYMDDILFEFTEHIIEGWVALCRYIFLTFGHDLRKYEPLPYYDIQESLGYKIPYNDILVRLLKDLLKKVK